MSPRGVQLYGSQRDGQDSALASQHPLSQGAGGEVLALHGGRGVSGHDASALGAATYLAVEDVGLGQNGEERRAVRIFPALHCATE